MALMHDDMKQADFTTRPCFENKTCKFNCGKENSTKVQGGLRKLFFVNEATW